MIDKIVHGVFAVVIGYVACSGIGYIFSLLTWDALCNFTEWRSILTCPGIGFLLVLPLILLWVVFNRFCLGLEPDEPDPIEIEMPNDIDL